MLQPIIALPQAVIEVNGAPLAPDQAQALTEVRVQQKLSLPTLCELTFSDPPGPLDAAASLAPGDALRVRVSSATQSTMQASADALFSGEITAIEHVYEPAQGRVIHVRGYDVLHRLRKRQTVRADLHVTLRRLIEERVADIGLTVEASEPGPVWDHLLQHRQSDFELIAELAEQCGLYFHAQGDRLRLFSLAGAGDDVRLALGESLLEARVDINSDASYRAVTASGWDMLGFEALEQTVEASRVGGSVPASEWAAERARQFGGSGVRRLVNEPLPSRRQAGALAQAELDSRIAREVTLWGIAEGNPRLQPGARVSVSGLMNSVNGGYVLTSVTHVVNERRGFLSEISSSPPPQRERTHRVVAAPARVTNVDDPDRRGRVKVALQTFDDIETDWMCVLMSGAGAGKGLINLPDVGDPVLVLFAQDSPLQGIVLGGVYGTTDFPSGAGGDDGVEGGNVRRYTLVTPGGQRIRLDDAGQRIRVEDSGGSYIELAPGVVKVHSAGRLEIEAPGNAVVIRGQTIDFERV